uniref:Large ribosomal subunit protein bL9c n=1 Tax=Caulacanthus okamurae TaxID=152008 RepID=A0A6H1U6W2_9FLOR|nr:50S ribosomal protein L9 [Caulacanthus okamurae]QIZ74622.1 50S ribosomal protein L9 [Caulacanthus okamurae]
MKKKTLIILKKTNFNIGQKGELLKVSKGYAFNYLIPQNIADLATSGRLKHFQTLKKVREEKLQVSKIKANTILLNLQSIKKISIYKKSSDKQQIFGRVQEKEIINEILSYTGYQFDKKQINIPDIKSNGSYVVNINVLNTTKTNINLNIIPEINQTNI